MEKAKILIVDDNEKDLQLLQEYLSGRGYDVVATQDGSDAFNQVQTHNPDLVIMDILMSKMSGWKVCQQIKDDVRYQHIPVLMCSGSIQEDDDFSIYGIGDGYIQKPFRIDRVVTVIQKLLDKTGDQERS